MKIAFACPSYGPVEPLAAASQRAAIMTAWVNGIQVRSDIFVDRVAWEASRNIVVKAFLMLDKSFDGIFWCDADSLLPQNAIVDCVGPGQDIVTGVYYGRHPPYEPKIFMYKESTDSFFHIARWPETTSLFPVDGAGFGCIYTSRRALELTTRTKIVPKRINHGSCEIENVEETFWFQFGRYSEDLGWCLEAKKKGLILWCNPNVEVGHLGEPLVVGKKERKAFVAENPDADGVTFVPDERKESERAPEHFNLTLQEDMRMIPSA